MRARTIGVVVLTGVLAFPPSIFADNITRRGGDPGGPNSFSIADNWTCATCASPVIPNNGNLGLNFDTVIAQAGADVSLDTSVTVNSLLSSIGSAGIQNITGTNIAIYGSSRLCG